MRALITTGLIGLAAISIAACNKPAAPGGPAAAAGGAPAAGPAIATGPLTPDQFPHRKSGLWRQTMVMDGQAMPGPGMQYCVDDASEAQMSIVAQKMPGGVHCPLPQFSRNLDGSMSFTSSCDMGKNGSIQTSGTIRGDFNGSYTMDSHSTYAGSPVAAMNGAHSMTITATWTGPCAPGQKGGDIIMPNGMTRNMLNDH